MPAAPSDILFQNLPILDVRAPGEFEQGRVPGASNLPLFTDEERKRVGICYKQQGQDKAVELGYKIVDPKLHWYIEEANRIAPGKKVVMYCWRGGLRSASMADHLRAHGFQVSLLPAGYKAWRRQVMHLLTYPWNFLNMSGMTGSGKTNILHSLRSRGEQVIDLEALANHKGSAFGDVKEGQPTSEHFENNLAFQLLGMDPTQPIWIEDESRNIGKVSMNTDFFHRLREAPIILINRSKEERVQTLCHMYGREDINSLKTGFTQIRKRIGGQHEVDAHHYLDEGDLAAAARIALRYYDKAYQHGLRKRNGQPVLNLQATGKTDAAIADELITWKTTHKEGVSV